MMQAQRSDLRVVRSAPNSAGRVPPHDLDAEASVLSAVLLQPDRLSEVSGWLLPNHFYSELNGKIFDAILDLERRSQPIDIVIVANTMREKGTLPNDGASYLAQIADQAPSVANLAGYAKIVTAKWRLRKLIESCHTIAAHGYGPIEDVDAFVQSSLEQVAIVSAAPGEEAPATLLDVFQEQLDDLFHERPEPNGLRTGLIDVDNILGPMLPGQLVVIGAHSGVGKSSLAVQIAIRIVIDGMKRNEPCGSAIFSAEMTARELSDRAVLGALRIDTSKRISKNLNDKEKSMVIGAASKMSNALRLIWVNDESGLSVSEIRAQLVRQKVEAKKRGVDLRLVVVDYLQLLKPGESLGGKGQDRRDRELANMSAEFKRMAKKLDLVVILVTQLNDDARREGRLPRGEDIRECKAVRADASKVILLNNRYAMERRAQMSMGRFDAPAESTCDVVDVIIDKNRGGKERRVCVLFTPHFNAFDNIEREDMERHLALERAGKEERKGGRS